jgi:hypothetical protein
MKVQTIDEMMKQPGTTRQEAEAARELYRVLAPCLKVKRDNGRMETTHGDKTLLGLYRTVKDLTK